MGLTPRIARVIYAVVGVLACLLAIAHLQSGYITGALFSLAIAVFAGYRLYQHSQEE